MSTKLDKVPFEEALNMTGFSKFNYLTLLMCCSIMMGMAFETMSVSYLVPASACELNTTSAQQGLIAGIPLIGITITSHVWGYLADTRGRRKVLLLSMLTGFLSGSAAAFSPHWIVLCFLKILSSSLVSGTMALSITLMSECTPQARRNSLVILTVTSFMTSIGLLAVVAIPILRLSYSFPIPFLGIEFNAWRTLSLVFSMPCAISAVALYFAYESPKYMLSSGDHAEALAILRNIYVMNSGKGSDLYMFMSGVAGLCINLSSDWILTVVIFIVYIAAYLNYTSLSAFSADMFPTYVKAMPVSVTLMSGRASAFLGVSLMKHFLNYDCETCFYFFSSFLIR